MRIACLAALLAALALCGAAHGNVLHISPEGDDGAGGSAGAPVRSLERLGSLIREDPGLTEVVFHGGTYRGVLLVRAPRGADADDLPPLLIRAADGAEPVLDGALPLPADQARPVEGSPGVYRFDDGLVRRDADRERGWMPPMWDAPARVRYALVADAQTVAKTPGSYTFADGALYLQAHGLGHPEGHSIEFGRSDAEMYGLGIFRPRVTVRGLAARNYVNDIHSAGFFVAHHREEVAIEDCRAFNCSRGVRFRGRNGTLSRFRTDDVGCGALINGEHVLIEDSVFLRGADDAFRVPMPCQENTGIEIYSPAGKEITMRRNVVKGFPFAGIFVKCRPGEFHVERNTLVGNVIGLGWSPGRGKEVFARENVFLGGSYAFRGQTSDQEVVLHRAYGNLIWHGPEGCEEAMRVNLAYMNSAEVGEGNVMADPRLAAPEAGEFRLLPGSPCLGAAEDGGHLGALGQVPDDFRDVHPPVLDLTEQPALAQVSAADDGVLQIFAASRREFPLRVHAYDSAGEVESVRVRVGDEPWGEPAPYAEEVPIRLPADEGEFEIQVRAADDAGNWSAPAAIRVQAAVAPPQLVGEPALRANRHGMAVSFRTNVQCFAIGEAIGADGERTPLLASGTTRPGDAGTARREHVLALLRPDGVPEGEWQYRVRLANREGDAGQEFSGGFRFEGEPTEYFVAPSGENAESAGTAGRPWRTPQYAVDRALPGDRVVLRPGLYLGGLRITRGGRADAPLTIAAERKWEAVLDGQRRVRDLVHLRYAPNVRLSGLEVRWYGDPRGGGYRGEAPPDETMLEAWERWRQEAAAAVRVVHSPDVTLSECKIWNHFWQRRRADGRGMSVEHSPGFTLEDSLVFRQDRVAFLYRSPRPKFLGNTIRSHVHGGLYFLAGSARGAVVRNNCLTYPGNHAYSIREESIEDLGGFDFDYNNLGTRIRVWRDEPGVVPNLPGNPVGSGGNSKVVAGVEVLGGEFVPTDRDAGEEGVWVGPEGQALEWRQDPDITRGRVTLGTFEDWQAFSGQDQNSIYATPKFRDLVNFDFRLKPDSPNIGAGEGGRTIGAMPVYEPDMAAAGEGGAPLTTAENMEALLRLEAEGLQDGQPLLLLGFHEPADGGGGVFHWRAEADKAGHDGGTVVDPSHDAAPGEADWYSPGNDGQGCWVRELGDYATDRMFGAVAHPGDSAHAFAALVRSGHPARIVSRELTIADGAAYPVEVNHRLALDGGNARLHVSVGHLFTVRGCYRIENLRVEGHPGLQFLRADYEPGVQVSPHVENVRLNRFRRFITDIGNNARYESFTACFNVLSNGTHSAFNLRTKSLEEALFYRNEIRDMVKRRSNDIGIYVDGAKTADVKRVVVDGNVLENFEPPNTQITVHAILLRASYPVVVNNRLVNIRVLEGHERTRRVYGIYLSGPQEAVVRNNYMFNAGARDGAIVFKGGPPESGVIEGNHIEVDDEYRALMRGNAWGVYNPGNCVVRRNTFVNLGKVVDYRSPPREAPVRFIEFTENTIVNRGVIHFMGVWLERFDVSGNVWTGAPEGERRTLLRIDDRGGRFGVPKAVEELRIAGNRIEGFGEPLILDARARGDEPTLGRVVVAGNSIRAGGPVPGALVRVGSAERVEVTRNVLSAQGPTGDFLEIRNKAGETAVKGNAALGWDRD